MNNKYRTSLAFWTMGEKYWNLSRGVCEHIIRSRNKYILTSDREIDFNECLRKTKWNDVNMVIPLLFNFYHGVELMLKGFVLLSEGSGTKLDHLISELYQKFKKDYPNEKELVMLLGRYVDKSQMPILLCGFLNQNKLSVNRFYESLRYPFNNNLSQEYQHFALKYQGPEGLQFYRTLKADVNKMTKLIVTLGHSLEK
ncbi:MAG: hypothetical protein JXA41_09235 [Deltaproteobacteria bacterium]|nr:hypothetical protein [Deltaproteobacteria bacterium]